MGKRRHSQWHSSLREQRDVIVKLHTGQGKTLIGLLGGVVTTVVLATIIALETRLAEKQWTRVQNTLEVAADPQVRANGYIQAAETSQGTAFELVASPVQFDEAETTTARGPEFNEHGDEILTELGLTMDEILTLKAAGAVA